MGTKQFWDRNDTDPLGPPGRCRWSRCSCWTGPGCSPPCWRRPRHHHPATVSNNSLNSTIFHPHPATVSNISLNSTIFHHHPATVRTPHPTAPSFTTTLQQSATPHPTAPSFTTTLQQSATPHPTAPSFTPGSTTALYLLLQNK